MKHIFLIGMLCGVMITAAFTYVFAIPANNYHWRMEIWNRGGGAWTMDKNGHGPLTRAPTSVLQSQS